MRLFLGMLIGAFCLAMSSALAQEERQTPRSTCLAIADAGGGIVTASAREPIKLALGPSDVRITYVGHSTFRIEDATGLKIATDYSGFAGLNVVPDVVTMNHAHTTHFTSNPDPRIPHVLRGWGQNGEPADHNIQVGEVIIRNVTTDINSVYSGFEENGNSIFIFEMGGLCIGHLGHLHHLLTDEHYAAIGRLDILMVPVDGGYTMNLPDMVKVVKRLNASMIMPMHWFGSFSLQEFLASMSEGFPVDVRRDSSLEVSLNTLPPTATVVVLSPESFIQSPGFDD
ncbi:MAG: MBL fold metallo-hydrolase [Pseudomonadota bacterium]